MAARDLLRVTQLSDKPLMALALALGHLVGHLVGHPALALAAQTGRGDAPCLRLAACP